MDPAAKKSFEIQAQVRHNAQDMQKAMKDLYDWEKEMKQQELQALSKATNGNADLNDNKPLPVRSHLIDKAAKHQEERQQNKHQPLSETVNPKKVINTATKSEEKLVQTPNLKEQKLKEANVIKDAGNRHVKLQQYDLAIEEYNRAIEMCPDQAVFYTNRALCYLKMENYEDCIEDCDRAIQLDSLAVKAYYRRMQANESLGNYLDALKDCTTALTIEPKNLETKKSMERINERLRKNLKSQKGPNFSPDNDNFIEILPIDKPPYKRSSKPLRRVPITDVISPKETKTFQNLEISDDDIDKLFNSNCGPFVEVKKDTKSLQNKQEAKKIESMQIPSKASSTNIESFKSEINKSTPSSTTLTNESDLSQVDSNKIQEPIKEIKKNQHLAQTEALVLQNRPLPPPPNSTAQFYTHWKELSDNQKYQYLKSIDLKKLSKILGAGFDSETLTDCLRVLRNFYLPDNVATTAETILEISRNEGITILSLLMSTDDRKALWEIINSLKEQNSVTKEDFDAISTKFNLV